MHRERFKDGAGEKMHDSTFWSLFRIFEWFVGRSGIRKLLVKRAISLKQAKEKLKAGRYPAQGAAAARRRSPALTFLRSNSSRQLGFMLCKASSEACSQSRELKPILVLSFWIYLR